MTSVQDKVVFITGAGRGIGAEVARRLHNKGAKLVLTDLGEAELTSIAAELGGGEAVGGAAEGDGDVALQFFTQPDEGLSLVAGAAEMEEAPAAAHGKAEGGGGASDGIEIAVLEHDDAADLATVLENYAALLDDTGRHEQAKTVEQRATIVRTSVKK